MIIPIEKGHIQKIAEIDMACRKGEFLPKLGLRFLILLYDTLISVKGVFGYVFMEGNEIAGFVIGTFNVKGLFTKVILKNGWKMIFCLIPQIIEDISIIKNILETFLYPLRGNKVPIAAELLVIGVDERFRKRGVGKQLVGQLNNAFKEEGISVYKVTVTSGNKIANQFYENLNFKYQYSFNQYAKEWNLYACEL